MRQLHLPGIAKRHRRGGDHEDEVRVGGADLGGLSRDVGGADLETLDHRELDAVGRRDARQAGHHRLAIAGVVQDADLFGLGRLGRELQHRPCVENLRWQHVIEHLVGLLDRRAETGEGHLRDLFGVGDCGNGPGARRQRRAHHGDDLLAEDQAFGLALGDVGLRAVVFDQQLDGPAGDAAFVVDRLFGKQDAVAFGLAEACAGAGEREDAADLERPLLRKRARARQHRDGRSDPQDGAAAECRVDVLRAHVFLLALPGRMPQWAFTGFGPRPSSYPSGPRKFEVHFANADFVLKPRPASKPAPILFSTNDESTVSDS